MSGSNSEYRKLSWNQWWFVVMTTCGATRDNKSDVMIDNSQFVSILNHSKPKQRIKVPLNL